MTTQLSSQPARIDYGRLSQVGLLAIVAAIVSNLIARTLLLMIFPITPGFPGFTVPAIITMTTLGMLGATVALALVARMSSQPARTYTWVALVALVISCVPNVIFALNPEAAPPIPGAPLGTWLDWTLLIIFHVIAAAIAIWLLPRALKR
jgi:hypothetical protein